MTWDQEGFIAAQAAYARGELIRSSQEQDAKSSVYTDGRKRVSPMRSGAIVVSRMGVSSTVAFHASDVIEDPELIALLEENGVPLTVLSGPRRRSAKS